MGNTTTGTEHQSSKAKHCLGCKQTVGKGKRTRRGLCDTCYAGMRYAVRLARITEEQLMIAGELLPPGKGGRKPANQFTERLHAQK